MDAYEQITGPRYKEKRQDPNDVNSFIAYMNQLNSGLQGQPVTPPNLTGQPELRSRNPNMPQPGFGQSILDSIIRPAYAPTEVPGQTQTPKDAIAEPRRDIISGPDWTWEDRPGQQPLITNKELSVTGIDRSPIMDSFKNKAQGMPPMDTSVQPSPVGWRGTDYEDGLGEVIGDTPVNMAEGLNFKNFPDPIGPLKGDYTSQYKVLTDKNAADKKAEMGKENPYDYGRYAADMEALSPLAQTAMKFPATQAQILAKVPAMDFSAQAKQGFELGAKKEKERKANLFKHKKLLADARKARLERENKLKIAEMKEDNKWEMSEEKNKMLYENMSLRNQQEYAKLNNKLDQINTRGSWESEHIDRRSDRKREEMKDQYSYNKFMQDDKMQGSLKELGVKHGYSMTALKATNAHDFKKAIIRSDDRRYNTDKVYQGKVDTLANNRFLQKSSQKHELNTINKRFVNDMDKMGRGQLFQKELLGERQKYNLETLAAKSDYGIKEMEIDSRLVDWRAKNRFAEKLLENDKAYGYSKLLQQDRHRHAVGMQGRLFKNKEDLQNAQFGQDDKILARRQGHAQAILASKWGFQMKHLAESKKLTAKQQMDYLNQKMEHDYKMQDKKASYDKRLQSMKQGHDITLEKIKNKYKETSGEQQLNRDYAKSFVKWETTDKALVKANIAKLKKVEQWIRESQQDKGASISGFWVSKGGETFRSLVHKRSVEAERLVRQVTQLDLKKILGGQFAEKEGERMLNSTYDKSANESDNLYRIRMLRTMMETRANELDDQQAHFRQHRTMKNYFGGSKFKQNPGVNNSAADVPLSKDMTREQLLELKKKYDEQGIR